MSDTELDFTFADEWPWAGMPERLHYTKAAWLLGAPNHFIAKEIDAGRLPADGSGDARTVSREDLIHYRARRTAEKRDGLRELIRLSAEMGGYEGTEPSGDDRDGDAA